MEHSNIVEFSIFGDYALFSNPDTSVGGEKCSYQIPTYEALKGILKSVYWKPTIIWYIDKVRIMNPFDRTETKGILTLKYSGGNDLAYYTYLKDCHYQVSAHFEWNKNRPELEADHNENKHYEIAKRMIERGGRRDIFLGTRECQGYVEPCVFGEDTGAYDDLDLFSFGHMFHSITYADEAFSEETRNRKTLNFWYPEMKNGIIKFLRPQDCPNHKYIHEMEMKKFGADRQNFTGLKEFEEVR